MPLPPFLAACRGLPVAHTPIWILRQAGRYLPEYRALREKHSFLEVMRTPELAVEATLQPIRRFPLDAAILFADIMTPVDGLGLGLGFAPGPQLERPVRTLAAVDALRIPDQEEIEASAGFVMTAIRGVRQELPAQVPLICFAGAPFTLFCYLVEGRGGGRQGNFPAALSFLSSEPAAAACLLDKLTDLTIVYLAAQAEAGAQALMLFDSWAGLLEPARFRALALPRVQRILEALARFGLPRIYFPRCASTADDPESSTALIAAAASLPVEVLGIDWRVSLARARTRLGGRMAVQGNLEPAALHLDDAELDRRADLVLAEAGAGPGHIFNLGHGIEPATDPAKLARLIDRVHQRTAHGALS